MPGVAQVGQIYLPLDLPTGEPWMAYSTRKTHYFCGDH